MADGSTPDGPQFERCHCGSQQWHACPPLFYECCGCKCVLMQDGESYALKPCDDYKGETWKN